MNVPEEKSFPDEAIILDEIQDDLLIMELQRFAEECKIYEDQKELEAIDDQIYIEFATVPIGRLVIDVELTLAQLREVISLD